MFGFVDMTADALLIVILFLFIFILIMFAYFFSKIKRLENKYKTLMGNDDNIGFEKLFLNRLDNIKTAQQDIVTLKNDYDNLHKKMANCIQKVGVVRFNAFDDTGSDLSYAVSFLDENDNGVVLSGLYARSESRSYAKPIQRAQSSYMLTDEEKKAIMSRVGTH